MKLNGDVREFSSPIDPRKKIDNFVPPQSFAYFMNSDSYRTEAKSLPSLPN